MWCIIHDWTLWSELEINKEGKAFQVRRCCNCGKIEIRWI